MLHLKLLNLSIFLTDKFGWFERVRQIEQSHKAPSKDKLFWFKNSW